MYYTAKKSQGSTRYIGIGAVVLVNGLVAYGLATGVGTQLVQKLTQTEVVIIETPEIEEEEPPPPPPVDVELPPPPPQVILPDFVFDAPPPPTAISQAVATPRPAPPPVARPAPPPAPPPAPVMTVKPQPRRNAALPEYPAASRRAKEEGIVSLKLCVDKSGRVTKAEMTRSSGFPRLDEATMKWIERERLQPARAGNTPIDICDYPLDYEWKLTD